MKWPDRRYLAWGAGLALTAALPLFSGFTTLGWECAEWAGFLGLLACLLLASCPVRPRESRPPVLLSLARHETLGLAALAASLLHVAASLGFDPVALEYLKPTAPLYQLAGIGALLLLLILASTSFAAPRRRLWRSHRNFQAWHIALGCVLIALLAAHVVSTARYTHGVGRRTLFVGVVAAGVLMLLRRRRGAPAGSAGAVPRRLVFGRHSPLIATVIAVLLLALSALIAGKAGVALREPLLSRARALPLNFDHGKHSQVNCLLCHHNYADGRGFDGCIHCHRGDRADLSMGVEARFHDFCLNCHRDPPAQFERHGPVSGCTLCHQVGTAPN